MLAVLDAKLMAGDLLWCNGVGLNGVFSTGGGLNGGLNGGLKGGSTQRVGRSREEGGGGKQGG